MLDPAEARRRIEAKTEEPTEASPLSPKTLLHVDVTDGRGKRYVGDFTFTVPTIGDQVKIGQLKAMYLPNGATADPNAAALVEQICYLEVCLGEPRPAWWQPQKFFDNAPLLAVYKEALDYERKFLNGDTLSSGNEAVPGKEGEPSGSGDAALGGEVQPATKRPQVLSDNGA